MQPDQETQKKIQDAQILEQNLQALLAQKQTVQLDLNEASNALEEIDKSSDEVYKILSGVMLKSTKDDVKKELEEKRKLLELRIVSTEKQQVLMEKRMEELKDEITKIINKETEAKSK